MCFDLDGQYMFGMEFLLVPIFNEEGTRNVYLPKGTWVDFFSGKVFTGKQWIARKKEPLASMPLFVRKGAITQSNPWLNSMAQCNLCKTASEFLIAGKPNLPEKRYHRPLNDPDYLAWGK
jgi:alpha-glucosidase (family GH31 glycosyl hydrolase)